MKTDYSTVIFSDEYRTILDGTDGRDRDWILHANSQPT